MFLKNLTVFIIQAPLDQFWGRVDTILFCSSTNSVGNVIIIISFFFFFLSFIGHQIINWGLHFYSVTNFIFDSLYDLVKSILKSTTSLKRNEHFSILFYLFIFLLFSNLIGLLPYSFTLTSMFSFTLLIAFGYFMGINLMGIWKRKWELASIFFADGVPVLISPLLVPIEVISYFARIFSLSIRLFANMMSGHALLKILIGFCWTLLISFQPLFMLIAILPWLIVTLILLLEFLIAFLQSYVFVTLLSIYINDVTTSH